MKKTPINQLWKKKMVLVIALLVGIFAFLPLLSALSIDYVSPTPNDGITIITDTFTVAVNVTATDLANVTFYLYDSTGNLIDTDTSLGINYCYQETANDSNINDGNCELNYTGEYSGSTFSEVIDGDWNTCHNSGSGDGLYINYTKPLRALNSSLWITSDWVGYEYNISIPLSCWNYDTNKLVLYAYWQNGGVNINYFSCYNGSDWDILWSSANYRFCEEAMIWDISNMSGNYSKTYSSISDGLYYYNVTATDISNNKNSTLTRNITIDTTKPYINIIYPISSNYNFNIIELNYTSNGVSCWYSLNLGVTNSTSQTCGINFTNLTSIEGANAWTVYANNSLGNEALALVSFVQDTINPSISITYPLNIVYHDVISTLNYLTDGIASNICWYSLDNGIINHSAMMTDDGGGRGRGGGRGGAICDTELSNLVSIVGSNTWTVYINDTAGNVNSSSVTFVISSWTSETGETVYNLMNGAGAGLGIVITYISSSIFGLLVLIALICVFSIIGYALARTIIEQLKNSQK